MDRRNLNIFKTSQINVNNLNNDNRNENLLKQIGTSFVLKVIAVFLNILLVPLILNYLGQEKYGIWVTMISLASWVLFLDIGIANGLRNKLTEALSLNKRIEAKELVSTAYISLSVIVIFSIIIILLILPFLNYQIIFNTIVIKNIELGFATGIILVTVFFNFVFNLVNQLINAVQKNALTAITVILVNTIFIIEIILSKLYTTSSLLNLSILYSIATIISSIIVSILFFNAYPYLIPSFFHFKNDKVRKIVGLGIQFFFIQLATIVIFATDNFLITQLLGPTEVTPYSITHKTFSTFSMIAVLLMSPLWSAYTEAAAKNDYHWIRKQIIYLNFLMIPIVIGVLILYLFFDYILAIWIGKILIISPLLKLYMGVFVIISIWNNIYSFFLNGISRTKEQVFTAIIGLFINIPLSIFFVKNLEMGSSGIILGTIISLSFFSLIGPFTTFKFLNKKINE